MTEWHSDSCGCFCELDSMVMIDKCTIHKTVKETLRHNNTLNLAFNPFDTDEKQELDVKLAKETYYERKIESESMIDRFRRFFGI